MTVQQPACETSKEQLSADALQQVIESPFFAHNMHLFVEFALQRASAMRYSFQRGEYIPADEGQDS